MYNGRSQKKLWARGAVINDNFLFIKCLTQANGLQKIGKWFLSSIPPGYGYKICDFCFKSFLICRVLHYFII